MAWKPTEGGCEASVMSLIWLLLTYLCTLTAARFSRIPETQTVSIGSDAVFECQFRMALSIGWLFGGVSVNQINDSQMDFTQNNYRDRNNVLVYTLTVLARPEYNGTTVVCVAVFLTERAQNSSLAVLIIEDTCGSFSVVTTFIEMPRSGIFADGSEARFRCRHRRTNRLIFEIDGLSVNDSQVENASIVVFPDGSGRSLFVLKFEATQVVDGSTIVCIAVFTNGCPDQETIPALLLIQGPLSTVTGFRRLLSNQLVFSWTPPPTLDLTGVDPDIAYSIKVYNVTCGSNNLVNSNYNLTTSFYGAASLDPRYIYKVEIVPRSNVPGAMNGAAFVEYEKFGVINVSLVVAIENSSGVIIDYDLQSDMDMVNAHARSYSLFVQPIDNPEGSVTLDISEAVHTAILPRRQLWFMTARAYGCKEHNVSEITVFSTHDVQDISATPIAGGISITGQFINNSSAVGILIIAYSIREDSEIQYMFAQRPKLQQETETTLTGLSPGEFQVSIFVIDKGRLPFHQVATLPRNVSISKENQTVVELPIIYELHPTSTGVCITCTFLGSSTTDCVAVVHQRISQLSSSGLMNIESSDKFNRSGDTAYGCIEGVDLEQYQVGVVGGRPVEQSKVSVPVSIIVSVVMVSAAIFAGMMILLLVSAFKYKRIKKKGRFGVAQETNYGDTEESSFTTGHATNAQFCGAASDPVEANKTTAPPLVLRKSQKDIPTHIDETALLLGDQTDAGNQAPLSSNCDSLVQASISGVGMTVSTSGDDARHQEVVEIVNENVHFNDEQMPGQVKPSSQSTSQDHDPELVVTPPSRPQITNSTAPLNSQVASSDPPVIDDATLFQHQVTSGAPSNSQDANDVPPVANDGSQSNFQVPSVVNDVVSSKPQLDSAAPSSSQAANGAPDLSGESLEHTDNLKSDSATNGTNEESQDVRFHLDDVDMTSTISSTENHTGMKSTPSQNSLLNQEEQRLFRQEIPESSSDSGRRLSPSVSLRRDGNFPLSYQLQQSDTFH